MQSINITETHLIHLIILTLTPVIILIHHAVLTRLNKRLGSACSNQSVCLIAIAAATLFESVLLLFFGLPGSTSAHLLPTVIYSVLIYLLLGYTYFHLFNMSETARRIRLLYEIDSGGTLLNSIDNSVDAAAAACANVQTRLNRLVALGQIECKTGYYVISGRTLLFGAHLLRLWGMSLGIDILKK